MRRLLVTIALVGAACGASGPDAPVPSVEETVCSDEICIAYPGGWDVEMGEGYIGFSHPEAPDRIRATAAVVNMEAIATSAGVQWPAPPDDVSRAFWQLLEDADAGQLGTLERRLGGAIETSGVHGDGRLWHLLVPVDTRSAIGVEVRGPNRSWETHAEVFFSAVAPS